MIQDITDKNVYQLQTCNGYVLKNLYNGERLQHYYPLSDSKSLWFVSLGLQKKEKDMLLTKKRHVLHFWTIYFAYYTQITIGTASFLYLDPLIRH